MTGAARNPPRSASANFRRAKDLENGLEEYFYRQVRRVGGMIEKLTGGTVGAPDRLVLLPGGWIFLVELKTDDGEVRPDQKVWHRKAATRGTEVLVLSGREQIDQWIREVTS